MPTQEELLEEAKITEEENTKSLGGYLKQPRKQLFYNLLVHSQRNSENGAGEEEITSHQAHVLRTHDTLPLTNHASDAKAHCGANPAVDSKDLAGKCERTFVTIENDFNDKVFQSLFRHKAPPKASNGICPITRLPARYFDPITQQPYYSIQAFKILREAYYMQLEQQGGGSEQPELAKWLEWRKLVKENRLKASAAASKNGDN